jgi:hypothetical protein
MSRRSFGTIRRLGSGRYQVRYRSSVGRMVPGPGTFATKAEAQRWLATAEADHLRGTFVDQRGSRSGWRRSPVSVRPRSLAIERPSTRTSVRPSAT